jgi:hypothetical protein
LLSLVVDVAAGAAAGDLLDDGAGMGGQLELLHPAAPCHGEDFLYKPIKGAQSAPNLAVWLALTSAARQQRGLQGGAASAL